MQPRDRQIARASAAVLGIATLGLAVAVAHQQIQSFHYPDPVNFLELDARYHFGAVLVVPELASPLIRWLRASRTWRLVVDDPAGTLFVRERH
jgi:hypothetical protein